MRLAVGSYNIHRCVGLDGRCSPERIADVIAEMAVDVVALQEVDGGYFLQEGRDQLAELAEATGMEAVAGPTLTSEVGHYGNALLTKKRAVAVRHADLSVAGKEPRGALDVDLEVDGHSVQLVVTHLGLRRFERVKQVDQILRTVIGAPEDRLIIVAGDFNEWRPGDHSLRPLHARFGRSRLRTFPSRRPVFAFDRILVEPRSALVELTVHDTPLARVASDHLPVKAIVES
ncbi:MAG TPA: endonuclease/exonuclease/phosphatase family protein [Candidatus Binatia bacterium]